MEKNCMSSLFMLWPNNNDDLQQAAASDLFTIFRDNSAKKDRKSLCNIRLLQSC